VTIDDRPHRVPGANPIVLMFAPDPLRPCVRDPSPFSTITVNRADAVVDAMGRVMGLLAASILLLVIGAAAIAKALGDGDAELSLVLVFPVISGSGGTFALGAVSLFAGVLLLFLSGSLLLAERQMGMGPRVTRPAEADAREVRVPGPAGGSGFGGVVFIGPIPIVFGSGSFGGRLMLAMAVLATVLLVLFFLAGLL
jgi:uncharacterized protein (TIGR00304 family)